MRIGYFVGCGVDVIQQDAGHATLQLLKNMAKEVHVLDNCCCGLPPWSYGDIENTKVLANKNPEAFAALEAAQQAGGDKRGKQSAALLIVREGWGYGGQNDRYRDLRDSPPNAPSELALHLEGEAQEQRGIARRVRGIERAMTRLRFARSFKTTPGASRSTDRMARMRTQVLDPKRHVAAFDLENTLISSNVVESYSFLATRRLNGPERVRYVMRTLAEAPGLLQMDRARARLVPQVGHGVEAIEVATTHGGRIHLLLTDVVMPKMDGHELYLECQERHPDLPVLMMTAFHYDKDHIIKRSRMEGLEGVIFKKPVDPQRLRQVILDTLDQKQSR